MTIEVHKFWLVWNPNGRNPGYRHSSRESAQTEAERLAALNPGASFFVVKGVGGAFADRPVAQTIRLIASPPDTPF